MSIHLLFMRHYMDKYFCLILIHRIKTTINCDYQQLTSRVNDSSRQNTYNVRLIRISRIRSDEGATAEEEEVIHPPCSQQDRNL
jgi:hypothetical protein